MLDDLISRQSAIDAMKSLSDSICEQQAIDALKHDAKVLGIEPYDQGYTPFDAIITIHDIPNAQPEHTNSCYTNSWCINCKEYDKEKHSCPRFNRVIKQTLDEVYAHAETEAEARFHAEIVRCKECRHRDPEDHKCDCGHDIIWQLPRDDKWY
jgi:hypothetical protein